MSRLRLEPLGREHVPDLLATMSDPDVLRFTRTPVPMPDGWVEEWLRQFDGEHRAAWAVLLDDRFAGYAVTGPINRADAEVELGYAVAPWARGQGVATETLRELTRWAFAEGMQRVTALISVENPGSSRVVERVGYTYEGVLRSVHHRDGARGDLQSWSILPGDVPDLG